MLILGILGFGLFVGFLAQLVVPDRQPRAWGEALVAGLAGSFVGGTLASLLAGDGFRFRPSGLIGSFVGAVIVLLALRWYNRTKRSSPTPNRGSSGSRR